MKALILAAGYATRLYPLTLDKPKALLPVGSKPILNHILDKIYRLGSVERIFVITNHKFFSIFKKWAQDSKLLLPIDIIDDRTRSNEDRLGAVGDINFAIDKKKIKDDLLVVGGDNLFEDHLSGFLDFSSKKNASCIALHDLKTKELAKKYGIASIDSNNKIIDFQEKPAQPKSTLISTCIYYFPSAKLKFFKTYLTSSEKKDASGYYVKWLSENDLVYGYALKGKWYDIGDMESYKKAEEDFG